MIEQKDFDELQEYIELEGTEIGETCGTLSVLCQQSDYLSDEFIEALEKEVMRQLNNFRENTVIEERVIDRFEPCTVKELVWK
jgi:hypothetical protein